MQKRTAARLFIANYINWVQDAVALSANLHLKRKYCELMPVEISSSAVKDGFEKLKIEPSQVFLILGIFRFRTNAMTNKRTWKNLSCIFQQFHGKL